MADVPEPSADAATGVEMPAEATDGVSTGVEVLPEAADGVSTAVFVPRGYPPDAFYRGGMAVCKLRRHFHRGL